MILHLILYNITWEKEACETIDMFQSYMGLKLVDYGEFVPSGFAQISPSQSGRFL